MKTILLSADNAPSLYSVPDRVAENLSAYCVEFDQWLWHSEQAQKYHIGDGVCYDERDFIDYLNTWIFPDTPSVLLETLPVDGSQPEIPEQYRDLPWFNFYQQHNLCRLQDTKPAPLRCYAKQQKKSSAFRPTSGRLTKVRR